jgi:DNA-binding CsgD family transcriptional regulator
VADSLRELTDAVALLGDEARVLELAARAMYEACGRGVAFGLTSRGERSQRLGIFRVVKDGALVPVEFPALGYARGPAIAHDDVPPEQRNRWIEPFRDGVASVESFKKGTLYPLAVRLGFLHQGRVSICSGKRQVAGLGVGVPESADFTDPERERLRACASALVVPVRAAAVLAASAGESSALERMLDTNEEVVLATDGDGNFLDGSRAALALLRRDRSIPDRLRAAVRAMTHRVAVVRSDGLVIHVSPCAADGRVAYLAVIDGAGFAEAPIELTDRQRELLGHLAKGLTNAQIAETMEVAPSTVKTMLERLYERTGVANRVELLAWSHRFAGGG